MIFSGWLVSMIRRVISGIWLVGFHGRSSAWIIADEIRIPPDELLPLSGIQHFVFCRRQWALIHVERQWQENALTAEGKLLHKRADDPFFTETRNGVITARSVPIASYRLGLAGVCDVVEFTRIARRRAACRDGKGIMRPPRWNTNAATKNAIPATKRSYAPRRSAWRKCFR